MFKPVEGVGVEGKVVEVLQKPNVGRRLLNNLLHYYSDGHLSLEYIYTEILKTSKGKVVAWTIDDRTLLNKDQSLLTTLYGFLIAEIPWTSSSIYKDEIRELEEEIAKEAVPLQSEPTNPSNYSVPYNPPSPKKVRLKVTDFTPQEKLERLTNRYSKVYIVRPETTEEGKRELAKILREECGRYGVIKFFPT